MVRRELAAEQAKIEDVARAAGVSIMTVSRAMRGVEGVSNAKRREIMRIADKLGYQPNWVARSLAAANSTLIGVSVPTLFDAVFAEIFDGMRSTFIKTGFQTVIDTSEYRADREEQWVEQMISWHPAGIILSGIHHSDKTRAKLRASGIPTLEIWDHTDDPIDLCVGFDHLAAGHHMGQFLAGLGYRRPAYVGVEQGRDPRAEKRYEGLCEAFREIGSDVTPNARVPSLPSFEGGRLGTEQVLSESMEPPDVIYYLNDHMAFGGMMTCEQRGLRVPQHVGIVGFNGLNINTVLPKPLTTSVTPRTLMGTTGARLLVAKIRGAKTERSVIMPVELFEGGTTRRQQGATDHRGRGSDR